MVIDKALDWAYERLVNAAYTSGADGCKLLAGVYRAEVIDSAYIAALYDLEHATEGTRLHYAYTVVHTVCKQLLEERKTNG